MNWKNIIARIIPVQTIRRILDIRQEPAPIAGGLDVDRLSQILDAASRGEMEDYFSLCRDIISGHSHASAEFGKRKLAVLGDDFRLSPYNPKDAADSTVSKAIESNLESLDEWMDVQLHLLDSTLYPVSLVEKIYRPSNRPGWHYEIAELRPVPHRLLTWTSGELRIRDVDARGNVLATSHAPDPMRYIVARVHAHTGIPDTWGGPMRAVVFWWLFAVMDRHWWARFLDRFGAPFIVAKYDDAEDDARVILNSAFQTASKLFGLAVPRSVEIELQQASSTATDAFEKFHATANAELSKVIVGQTLSAEGQNLGLGGGQASVQESVRQDIRQFDARRLGHILRTQLFAPLCRLNAWQGKPPIAAWGGESAAELTAIGSVLPSLADAGVELTDDGIEVLSGRLGLGLRRATAAAPPGIGLHAADPLSAARSIRRSDAARRASDQIAAAGADEFAEAMVASLAPVAKILAASDSLQDFETRLRDSFPNLPSRKAASILSATLVANSTNAILNFPHP